MLSDDQINKLLIAAALIALLLKRWISGTIIWIFVAVCIALFCYRFLSKKIYVRSNENQKILAFFANFGTGKKKVTKEEKEQNKRRKQANINSVIFNCEHCGQALRAPQGKGKIKVTCNNCQHVFLKEV